MSDSSSMRVLPEGINVVAVSPAVLVANIADWRNDHKGGGGRDKPRVFFLEDGEYKWITLLVEMLVIRACYIGIGAGHHRVYADSVLWIEVLPAAVSENLCEPMVEADPVHELYNEMVESEMELTMLRAECGGIQAPDSAYNYPSLIRDIDRAEADAKAAKYAYQIATLESNVQPVALEVVYLPFALTSKGKALGKMLNSSDRPELTDKGRRAARRMSSQAAV